eukprot:tig00000806_g4338.t1
MTTPLEAAVDLFRRLPPANTRRNLERVIELRPDLTEELLERIDQPLEVRFDPEANREFVLCEYNRDGDSYRSPWSNKYFPPLEDGAVPSARLRAVEVGANELFDSYREMYYGNAASSVYFWDLETGFAVAVLFRKAADSRAGQLSEGVWDATHVVEVTPAEGGASKYRLSSSLLLWLKTRRGEGEGGGGGAPVELSARLERRAEQEAAAGDSAAHVANVGRMVEEMEGRLRTALEVTHAGKAREVLSLLRPGADLEPAAAARAAAPGPRRRRGGPTPE